MEQKQANECNVKDNSQLRVSVAMATYNGEKYIEEQLLSICHQTRRVDEIIISDDGSKDKTLEIVEKISKSEDAAGIDFVVLTDNPRHGFCGNFEWAIKHTTGDLVFLSDQDDVWMPEKTEAMMAVFEQHPDAECVCHNAKLIDGSGNLLEGVFDRNLSKGKLDISEGEVVKIDREPFLEESMAWGAIRGMCMCLSRKFVNSILPFPVVHAHDKWITFCAMVNDKIYYQNQLLVLYRLHGSNLYGNSAYRGTFLDRMKRIIRLGKLSKGAFAAGFETNIAMEKYMIQHGYTDLPAYRTVSRLAQMGETICDAEISGRLIGAVKISKLYLTDLRYRRSGTMAFLIELIYILMNTKKTRIKNIEQYL